LPSDESGRAVKQGAVEGCECAACSDPNQQAQPYWPVDDCVFKLEPRGDQWVCPNHGPQNPHGPEYETTNDRVETKATGLGDFA